MNLSLDPSASRLINDRMKSGKYASPEELIVAALHALDHEESDGDFAPGELDALIEEGEASGDALNGESVLAELRELRESRRQGKRS